MRGTPIRAVRNTDGRWACLAAAPILLASVLVNPAVADVTGKARVIDGDTIEIARQHIRLHGIDAPEGDQQCQRGNGSHYSCGEMAGFVLAELVAGHWVTCRGTERDQDRRLIATCFTGPVILNAEMVRGGWALAYRRESTEYVEIENSARTGRRGMWQGRFIAPWDWRRAQATGERKAAPTGTCLIKGSISRRGERFYHLPGGQDYARTRINQRNGERWFCSEAEARAAGWRRMNR